MHTEAVPAGFLDHATPLAFAHRGGAGQFPENSWRAFEHAVKLGYAYLETDAHATADGTVVAFHDRTLDRVTDGTGRIAELTTAQVTAARIGGSEPIPLLAELITAWPGVRYNIDVKDEPVIGPLVEVLRATSCLGPCLPDIVLGPAPERGQAAAAAAGLHRHDPGRHRRHPGPAAGQHAGSAIRRALGPLRADPVLDGNQAVPRARPPRRAPGPRLDRE